MWNWMWADARARPDVQRDVWVQLQIEGGSNAFADTFFVVVSSGIDLIKLWTKSVQAFYGAPRSWSLNQPNFYFHCCPNIFKWFFRYIPLSLIWFGEKGRRKNWQPLLLIHDFEWDLQSGIGVTLSSFNVKFNCNVNNYELHCDDFGNYCHELYGIKTLAFICAKFLRANLSNTTTTTTTTFTVSSVLWSLKTNAQ